MFLGQVCEPGRDPRCGLTGPRGSGLEGPARFTDGPRALCPRGRAEGLCGSGWPSACRACPKPPAVFNHCCEKGFLAERAPGNYPSTRQGCPGSGPTARGLMDELQVPVIQGVGTSAPAPTAVSR